MYLLISKIIFAASIFLLSIITGFLPLRIAKHNTKLFALCDAFASGVFLSTALMHLLPDAIAKFEGVYTGDYPIAYLICVITCIVLFALERAISIYSNKKIAGSKLIMPIFVVALFCVHSLFEGAAIGANDSFLETAAIFFAVFAHKGSESFALTVNLRHFGLSNRRIHQIVSIFATMTPMGILVASSMVQQATNGSGSMLSGVFNAVTAGTFLYLGTEHLIEDKKLFGKPVEILALLLGVGIMALVAIWV